MGPGNWGLTSPTPGTSPVSPCQQQLLQHSVLRHPVPSLVGGYCFICCSRIPLPHCPCYCTVSVVINTTLLSISFTAGVWWCWKGMRHRWRSAGPQWRCGVRHCSQDFKAYGLEGDKNKGKHPIDRMVHGLLRCCLQTFYLLTEVLKLSLAMLKASFAHLHNELQVIYVGLRVTYQILTQHHGSIIKNGGLDKF